MIRRTIVLSTPSYLYTSKNQLKIRFKDKLREEASVPLEDLGIVLLESQQITITNGLLAKFADYKIAVYTCDTKHMPISLMLPMAGHTLTGERYRQQMNVSVPLKKGLWKQTIKAKINNQAKLLERMGYDARPLFKWSSKVLSGDSGFHESRAAAYYWPKLMNSDAFRRDPDGDPPNNLFNYAYAILRGIIARAIVGSGMLPALGIFHKNKYNAYALADDIMEPYRPFADGMVMDLYNSNKDIIELNTEVKQYLLKLPKVDVIIDGKRSPLFVAASRTTNSLYECFEGNRRKLLYPDYEV